MHERERHVLRVGGSLRADKLLFKQEHQRDDEAGEGAGAQEATEAAFVAAVAAVLVGLGLALELWAWYRLWWWWRWRTHDLGRGLLEVDDGRGSGCACAAASTSTGHIICGEARRGGLSLSLLACVQLNLGCLQLSPDRRADIDVRRQTWHARATSLDPRPICPPQRFLKTRIGCGPGLGSSRSPLRRT